MGDYTIGKIIGHGAYAEVRQGLNKVNNKRVAIKVYDKLKILDNNRSRAVKREMKILGKLTHPNIIQYYDTIDETATLNLVMELVEGGSLHSYLRK
mmetsp:Transcript_8514/g.4651  ORF Transcript_8514/g.4651 Transcript_8514/m.4651 type:complete len:96 (-) Transcript_8514:902-1189(-)